MNREASRLRTRAATLRTLAAAIERTPAMNIDHEIGPDTWSGPRARHCADELHRHQRRIRVVADELRWSAWRMEQVAVGLDTVTP